MATIGRAWQYFSSGTNKHRKREGRKQGKEGPALYHSRKNVFVSTCRCGKASYRARRRSRRNDYQTSSSPTCHSKRWNYQYQTSSPPASPRPPFVSESVVEDFFEYLGEFFLFFSVLCFALSLSYSRTCYQLSRLGEVFQLTDNEWIIIVLCGEKTKDHHPPLRPDSSDHWMHVSSYYRLTSAVVFRQYGQTPRCERNSLVE